MKDIWTFKSKIWAIADTGDYDGHWEFTNGNLTLISNAEMEEEDCQQLCDALNKFPGLWSPERDSAEFELQLAKRELNEIKFGQELNELQKTLANSVGEKLEQALDRIMEIDSILTSSGGRKRLIKNKDETLSEF